MQADKINVIAEEMHNSGYDTTRAILVILSHRRLTHAQGLEHNRLLPRWWRHSCCLKSRSSQCGRAWLPPSASTFKPRTMYLLFLLPKHADSCRHQDIYGQVNAQDRGAIAEHQDE